MNRRFWLYGGLATIAVPLLTLVLLPSKARVERSIMVSAAPPTVFALVRSQQGFDRFNPFKAEDPGLKTAFTGPDAGPEAAGGIWTPGAVMGRLLIERLEAHAGLRFAREA